MEELAAAFPGFEAPAEDARSADEEVDRDDEGVAELRGAGAARERLGPRDLVLPGGLELPRLLDVLVLRGVPELPLDVVVRAFAEGSSIVTEQKEAHGWRRRRRWSW